MRNWLVLIVITLSPMAFGAPCDGASGKNHKNPDGSQGGFVANTAKVAATVFLDASSSVCEQAKIQGNVKIKSGSWIAGSTSVEGNSEIVSSRIYGSPRIYGKALVVNSAVCQASDVNFKVSDSNYYCLIDDPEPKHPGEAGKRTLMGIDSDVDGVRDDIEIWINNRTTNTPKRNLYNVRGALRQIATKIKENMLVKDNPASAVQLRREVTSAFRCLNDVSESESEYEDLKGDMMAQYLNTMDRIKAEIKMEGAMRGQILHGWHGLEKRSSCEFKLKNQ